jgi:acyl-CoA synthetase (AMP-forming)/AMP-acid ligase II
VDVLRWRARAHPERRAFSFLVKGEADERYLTYGELDRQARAIGALLQDLGAAGERALLLYPAGLEFICAFFGCLYAGTVAVPAPRPLPGRSLSKIEAIAADSQPVAVLTSSMFRGSLEHSFIGKPPLAGLRIVATCPSGQAEASRWRDPEVDRRSLAFLQYTSGSTGTPKGVMVSHDNLLYHSRFYEAYPRNQTGETVSVSWLPHFHDMGLIDGIIQPVLSGCLGVLMSPAAFIQQPVRWLRAISRLRGSHSGGPDFAYDLCVRTISREQSEGLDLSCWVTAYNGAEPVRAETLERFASAFAPRGFSPDAFLPVYGLAEATLMVSGAGQPREPVLTRLDANALRQHAVRSPQADETGAGHPLATWPSGRDLGIRPHGRSRLLESTRGDREDFPGTCSRGWQQGVPTYRRPRVPGRPWRVVYHRASQGHGHR